jgi:glycosyltransferase involved in cell wall biosynthesis
MNARLIILGDGDLKTNLTDQAESLGLSVCDWELQGYKDADIYLMGFQINAFKFYHHGKLFALSSSWEGFPNVLAEALICNIPVVTTDCYTGPREILNIFDLLPTPTEAPVRIAVGTLLPLLTNPDPETLQFWEEEINYWLQAEKPAKEEFTKLTNRFTRTAMLKQWQDVIEN